LRTNRQTLRERDLAYRAPIELNLRKTEFWCLPCYRITTTRSTFRVRPYAGFEGSPRPRNPNNTLNVSRTFLGESLVHLLESTDADRSVVVNTRFTVLAASLPNFARLLSCSTVTVYSPA
jgi:hypothetical protein